MAEALSLYCLTQTASFRGGTGRSLRNVATDKVLKVAHR